MREVVQGFDWDAGNRTKCERHGVSAAEVEFVLANRPRIAPDIKHADVETRFIAVGATQAGRYVFVAFTFRQVGHARKIRPISARYMHAKEIARYASQDS